MLKRDLHSFDIFETCQTNDNITFLDKMTSMNMQPSKIKKDFALEFVEWYQRVINRATLIIEKWEKTTGLCHTCSPNCNACCYHLIEIYNYELLVIMTYLKITNQECILNDTIKISETIEKRLSTSPYQKINTDEDEFFKYKSQYRSLQIQCLFQKDKKCLIYNVRPTCCVTYYSYGLRKDCEQKLLLPQHCINYGSIEDWIVKQMSLFMEYNRNKIPQGFDPFRIEVLPISIRDYLVKLERQEERRKVYGAENGVSYIGLFEGERGDA